MKQYLFFLMLTITGTGFSLYASQSQYQQHQFNQHLLQQQRILPPVTVIPHIDNVSLAGLVNHTPTIPVTHTQQPIYPASFTQTPNTTSNNKYEALCRLSMYMSELRKINDDPSIDNGIKQRSIVALKLATQRYVDEVEKEILWLNLLSAQNSQ